MDKARVRLVFDDRDGALLEHILTIRPRFRAYEIKKILSDYLIGKGANTRSEAQAKHPMEDTEAMKVKSKVPVPDFGF